MPTHIFVTAPEGRKTPIAAGDGAEPGNSLLYVEAGSVARVRYSGDVRRSIARGDLIPVDADAKPTGKAGDYDIEKAAAPAPWKGIDKETGEEVELDKFFPDRHQRDIRRPRDRHTTDRSSEYTTDALRSTADEAPLFDTSELAKKEH